ncbi:MAG: helix-turn-helix transcriptional regulator [Hyphomicrobiaceae bacterium]|nr:helix-turn-helix transcriptional regulator [Hyphomicrobiaceae bacterium]
MKRGFAKGSGRNVVSATATVVDTWGGGDAQRVPDWMLVLAEACDALTRAKVAQRLSYSPSVISQLLNGSYKGDLERAADVIRGALMAATVQCPICDEIPRDVCLDHQKKSVPPFASSMRARLYRACPTCPNFRGSK